jgi:adenosylmethionine-8-amino-7-oxononanoate aminotransferase
MERGYEWKFQVIGQNPGYHGSTVGALAVSGRPLAKRLYHPLMHDFPLIPAPTCYRCAFDLSYPECGIRCAHELKNVIQQVGAETVSAFIVEPIIGTSAGVAVPPVEYFGIVREICDKHHVLLIADEILTGMGRTGTWLAIDHYNLIPDMVLLGKGIGGGYVPLSALAVREDIVQTIAEGTGSFVHGLTFAHTPMICAAGLATIRYMKQHELVKQSAEMGKVLSERLERLMDFAIIGDIRCKGLLAGIEFVEDKASKRPFPGASRIAERFTEAALHNGLVVWPNVGHIDGEKGDAICLGPPLIITEEQIDEVVTLLYDTLSDFVGILNA